MVKHDVVHADYDGLYINMKKIGTLFLTILVIMCSCSSRDKKGSRQFTLEGTIDEIDTGIVVLRYFQDESQIYDTVKIINGKFQFKGRTVESCLATLYWDNGRRCIIYLDPASMKISLSKNGYPQFIMTGSVTQADFDRLEKSTKPLYDSILKLTKQYRSINDSIKASADEYLNSKLRERLFETESRLPEYKKKIDSIEIQFVANNPASYCSVITLNVLQGNEIISLDSAKLLLNGLDRSLKNSSYGRSISSDIRKKENVKIGSLAPGFRALDINQLPVTLSQFKDKNVVLLDFWASWCVPCRKSIPHLKEIYNKYHSKGLEIIAVTTDTDKQAWIEAIHNDSTEMWYHIPVAEKYSLGEEYYTNDDICTNYFWGAIPSQILIDKEGRIINRWVGRSDAIDASIDQALSKLLN